jgi:hypothetical protein
MCKSLVTAHRPCVEIIESSEIWSFVNDQISTTVPFTTKWHGEWSERLNGATNEIYWWDAVVRLDLRKRLGFTVRRILKGLKGLKVQLWILVTLSEPTLFLGHQIVRLPGSLKAPTKTNCRTDLYTVSIREVVHLCPPTSRFARTLVGLDDIVISMSLLSASMTWCLAILTYLGVKVLVRFP